MQYAEGRIGRIFVLRIDDGEDILEEIKKIAEEESITTGILHLLGAMKSGMLVTGPEEPVVPPLPHFEQVEGGWELLGFGTLSEGEDGPFIHIHAAAGRKKETYTGCLRERAQTYLVVEVVILEITHMRSSRVMDKKTGVFLPVLEHDDIS